MKRILFIALIFALLSCNRSPSDKNDRIITVSIAPFRYFVEAIAGDDFKVNIIVPPGSNPHIYEPVPDQINKLSRSEAFISNGFLGFEMAWLDRFYEINTTMMRLSLGDIIVPISEDHRERGEHTEGADPHYWVSPKCALLIAASIKELLVHLNPSEEEKYRINYSKLVEEIEEVDKKASSLFAEVTNRSFMIYHPNLAYLARDYNLTEIPVEYEGKEPSPSRMKEIIDLARKENLKTIFVQKEFDDKNAKAIAHEIGAEIIVIDPLSEEWLESVVLIINSLHKSFIISQKQ